MSICEEDVRVDLSLEICQSLSEDMRTTFLCYLPESDWENILNSTFIHEFRASRKVVNGKPVVVRAFPKPKDREENSGFIDTEWTNENKQQSHSSFFENKLNDNLLVVPMQFNEEIPNSENEFYYNWRRKCICKVKSSIQPQLVEIKTFDQLKKGKTIQRIVNNLNFPDIKSTPPIILPQTSCQDILKTKSYSSLNIQDNENNNKSEWIIHHPGIAQIMKISKGKKFDYLVSDFEPYTLESLLKFSRKMFKNDVQKLFVIYQLIRGLQFAHDQGLIHGNITPCNILVSKTLWISYTGFTFPKTVPFLTMEESSFLHPDQNNGDLFSKWYKGEISNFDYIMALNAMAKRRVG